MVTNSAYSTLEWDIDLKGLRGAALRAAEMRYRAARDAAERLIPEIVAWLKANAPWQDVTGLARESLDCVLEEGHNSFRLTILGGGGTASHLVFLEFDNAGKFSIIGPALEYWTPIFARAIRDAVEGVR